MTKGRVVWIGRSNDGLYQIGARKMDWCVAQGFSPMVDCFCAGDFERVTRYKLKCGELKKIRISIEEV